VEIAKKYDEKKAGEHLYPMKFICQPTNVTVRLESSLTSSDKKHG
jgi:hypothetical protein